MARRTFTATVSGSILNDDSTWDASHDATAGDSVDTGFFYIGVNHAGSTKRIMRGFFSFDTSSIPDNATIISASLRIYIIAVGDSDNDGDDWINVVGPTTQADPTAIVTADFDQCGSIDNPTEGSTRKDLSSLSADTYLTFDLNATGLTWVSKTGYTLLGMREGHDATDQDLSTGDNTGNDIRLANAETLLTVNYKQSSVFMPLLGTG